MPDPVRYPRFRVRASEMRQSVAFAFGVPHDINGFHPYTVSSTDLSHSQSRTVSFASPRLSRGF